MDWLCPERTELRAANEQLRLENERLWSRMRALETRLDKISISQFLFTMSGGNEAGYIDMLRQFSLWVLR